MSVCLISDDCGNYNHEWVFDVLTLPLCGKTTTLHLGSLKSSRVSTAYRTDLGKWPVYSERGLFQEKSEFFSGNLNNIRGNPNNLGEIAILL